MADKRIPELLKIPAVVRGLSCELLLGLVDLEMVLEDFQLLNLDLSRKPVFINWVIASGESGPKARPCDHEWIRSIRCQCQAAGVPVFVKQMGSNSCQSECDGITRPRQYKHPKGGDPAEWQKDLQVRQFPTP